MNVVVESKPLIAPPRLRPVIARPPLKRSNRRKRRCNKATPNKRAKRWKNSPRILPSGNSAKTRQKK
jgi:hypothetical protein